MKKKPGRNDPCPCGSGKKFKKCCDKKMIAGKFMASKVDNANATASKLSSFFQNNVASSITPLGESGRTFTVQKTGQTSSPLNEPSSKDKTEKSSEEGSKESHEVVEPKGPEEEPPAENDEVHS